MCGRYTLATANPADVRARFPVGESVEIRPRYNVAPGDEVLTVTTDREGNPRGELLRWGLIPSWSRGSEGGLKLINARAETVAERPAFRGALQRFRCLVIADGFYEWQSDPLGGKRAFWITRSDGELFAFAGLWSIGHDESTRELRTCTILTTAANATVSPLHDRMPIILDAEDERQWLDPGTARDELLSLLRPLEDFNTRLRAVGGAVNDARYDGPACLAPPPAADQPALF